MSAGKQTAVLHDPFPLFLEAVEQLLTQIDVDVLAKTTSSKRVITILGERQPTLLVSELQGAEGTPDGIELVREALTDLQYGQIVITVHAGVVSQVESTEKLRPPKR